MKKLLLSLALAILGCNLPVALSVEQDAAATPLPSLTAPAPTSTPPQPSLGSPKSPLILALLPAAHANPEVIAAGEKIAAFIEARSGYRVATMTPASETNLVDALSQGNAHIAALSPFGYLAARQNDSVAAIFASARNGQALYGAQFIVNRESEFVPFFDPTRDINTAEAAAALKQFQDKKPCWSDATSPSGYVVPLGALGQGGVQTKDGAFLEGQASVVRAVYAGDICDFGATYVDGRDLPILEANYPDIKSRVIVVWRIPSIIPYENISVSNALPFEMRRVLQRAFIDLLLSPEHKLLLQQVYGIEELQIADDSAYAEFERYWKASGLNLTDLLE